MLIVDGDQVHGLGGAQVDHGGGGGAGGQEGGVDLAVLEALGGGAEGLEDGGDVLLDVQAIGIEHVGGVKVGAGVLIAHADLLALQIGNGLDGGVGGDDLHGLGIEAGQDPDVGHGADLGKAAGAVIGVGHHVGLDGGQLVDAEGHVLQVVGRTAGGHHVYVHQVGILFIEHIGQHAAHREVGARFTAGAHGQGLFRRGPRSGGHGEDHDRNQDNRQKLFHDSSPFPVFVLPGIFRYLHFKAELGFFQVVFPIFIPLYAHVVNKYFVLQGLLHFFRSVATVPAFIPTAWRPPAVLREECGPCPTSGMPRFHTKSFRPPWSGTRPPPERRKEGSTAGRCRA